MIPRLKNIQLFFGYTFIIVLTVFIYWPGLSGDFLLDDSSTLSDLSRVQEDDTGVAPWIYATEGHASLLGRPLAMLSFAFQAQDWPKNPNAFKFVNLILHVINGLLLAWLLDLLFRPRSFSLSSIEIPRIVPWFIVSIWLLHPLQVSTVLYVVQRMTEMATLFTLMGLIAYVQGRAVTSSGHHGLILMSVGVVLGGLLSVLCKETGVLLLIYILVLEYTLLREWPRPRLWYPWQRLFLIIPLVILSLGLYLSGNITDGYARRTFNLPERLFTEAGTLWEYLGQIFLPRPHLLNLFHDDHSIAQGLFHPPAVALAISGLLFFVLLAWIKRRDWPVFTFAVFWFLGGHLLESTVLPLELYFEHRNYLPLLGPLYAAVYFGWRLLTFLEDPGLRKITVGLLCVIPMLFPILTAEETYLWGNSTQQAEVWLKEHPGSLRARYQAAGTFFQKGDPVKATHIYQSVVTDFPQQNARAYLHLTFISCFDPILSPMPSLETLHEKIIHSHYDPGLISVLDLLIDFYANKKCNQLTLDQLINLTNDLLTNSNFKVEQYNIFSIGARLYWMKGDYDQGLALLEQSQKIHPDIYGLMLEAEFLAQAGRVDKVPTIMIQVHQMAKKLFPWTHLYEILINAWWTDLQKRMAVSPKNA